MFLDKFFRLYKKAAGAAARVVHAPLKRLQHFDNESDNTLGRIVLPALLALGHSELTEKIFVHVAEDVLGLEALMLEWKFGDLVDQAGQYRVNLLAGVILFQHAFEFGVFFLDRVQRVVQQSADAFKLIFDGLAVFDLEFGAERNLGIVPDKIPTRQRRDPENVLFGVVVAGLQFLGDQIVGVVTQIVIMFRIAEIGFQFRVTLLERV